MKTTVAIPHTIEFSKAQSIEMSIKALVMHGLGVFEPESVHCFFVEDSQLKYNHIYTELDVTYRPARETDIAILEAIKIMKSKLEQEERQIAEKQAASARRTLMHAA